MDSQPDPVLDTAVDAHQQELADLNGELGGLAPQDPNISFSQAPRVSCAAGRTSSKRVEVMCHLT